MIPCLFFFLPRKNKDSIGLRGIWGAQSQFCIYVTRSTVTSRCRKQVDNHIQAHNYTHTHIPNRTLRACECNSTAATCNGHSGHCGPVDCGWVLAFQLTSHRIRMGLMWGNCNHDLVNLVSIPLRYWVIEHAATASPKTSFMRYRQTKLHQFGLQSGYSVKIFTTDSNTSTMQILIIFSSAQLLQGRNFNEVFCKELILIKNNVKTK